MINTFIDLIAAKMCKHFGHRWQYRDYSNYIKSNGDAYDFKASRNCIRCNQYAYFYSAWQNAEKSSLDYEGED